MTTDSINFSLTEAILSDRVTISCGGEQQYDLHTKPSGRNATSPYPDTISLADLDTWATLDLFPFYTIINGTFRVMCTPKGKIRIFPSLPRGRLK